MVLNARIEFSNGDSSFPKLQSSVATVVCEPGYSSEDTFQTNYMIVCGQSGLWALPDGSIRLPACTSERVFRFIALVKTNEDFLNEGNVWQKIHITTFLAV